MSEFKRKRETRLPEKLRVDYILEGDAVKVFNKIKRENPSCKISEVQDTLNTLNAELEKLSLEAKKDNGTELLNQLESMSLNDEYNDNGTKKKRMNGGMTGMSATALIMYLIADAMREGAKYGYEQITKILAGGLKVLEFLSNKEGCTELVLRDYLGKRVMQVIQFFFLGSMVNEITIPIDFILKIAKLLSMLVPYVTKGISASIITAIGYIIYHFVNYYGAKLTETASKQLQELKSSLDALENATSESVVKNIIEKSNEVKNVVNNLMNELLNNKPNLTSEERIEFMNHIKTNLDALKKNRIGELDAQTINKIKIGFDARRAPVNRSGNVNMRYGMNSNKDYDRVLYSPYDGGKKHKKRKTQKRKNKSNKKTTKKSNKSKKHRK